MNSLVLLYWLIMNIWRRLVCLVLRHVPRNPPRKSRSRQPSFQSTWSDRFSATCRTQICAPECNRDQDLCSWAYFSKIFTPRNAFERNCRDRLSRPRFVLLGLLFQGFHTKKCIRKELSWPTVVTKICAPGLTFPNFSHQEIHSQGTVVIDCRDQVLCSWAYFS